MSNLLQEAIADANKVKEIAYENAKAAIEEAFQPKIQRMISTKLAEEDYEEEMPPEMEPELEPEMAPEMASEVPSEEEEYMGETYMEDGRNGMPDNPIKNNGNPQMGLDETDGEDDEIDEEFDRIIRELEGLDEEDDAYDDTVGTTKKNIGEGDDMGMEPEPEGEEDDLENLNLEALIRKLEEEEFGSKKPKAVQRPSTPRDVRSLQAENAKLKNENAQAFRAISEMKSTMNEVNLLNSKLMYSSKIIQSYDLSEAQQVKVLETFDRAQSVREVKLIYATIHEHYKGKTGRGNVRQPKRMTESASRTVRTVKANPQSKSTLMEGASRWQILAGLKPLND